MPALVALEHAPQADPGDMLGIQAQARVAAAVADQLGHHRPASPPCPEGQHILRQWRQVKDPGQLVISHTI
jgi:hypothetical protein